LTNSPEVIFAPGVDSAVLLIAVQVFIFCVVVLRESKPRFGSQVAGSPLATSVWARAEYLQRNNNPNTSKILFIIYSQSTPDSRRFHQPA
jgi:hypothetical protein